MSPASPEPLAHGSFTIERRFEAPASRVFAAWSEPAIKRQWFARHADWTHLGYEMDFRIGGSERSISGPAGGPVQVFEARFADIVPGRRIVAACTTTHGGTRISASLLSIEFKPSGTGTRLLLTEHVAALDPRYPVSSREAGTRLLLDNLALALQRTAVAA